MSQIERAPRDIQAQMPQHQRTGHDMLSQDKEFCNAPLYNILRDEAESEKAASSLIRNFRSLPYGGTNSVLRTGPSGRVVGSIVTDTVVSNLSEQMNGTVRGIRKSLSNHPPSSKTDKAPHPQPSGGIYSLHFRLTTQFP